MLFTPDVDPYLNMAIDDALTEKYRDSEEKPITIRFYTWKECSYTIGYSQKIKDVLKPLSHKQFPIIRRPTGGGIVFHNKDITFSIIKIVSRRNRQENITSLYNMIGKALSWGLANLGFNCQFYLPEGSPDPAQSVNRPLQRTPAEQAYCSLMPATYDILINGNKVAGYAARRSQGVILCQGYLDIYKNWKEKYKDSHAEEAIKLLSDNLAESFEKIFGITLTPSQLTADEKTLAYEIRDRKYASKTWNCRK